MCWSKCLTVLSTALLCQKSFYFRPQKKGLISRTTSLLATHYKIEKKKLNRIDKLAFVSIAYISHLWAPPCSATPSKQEPPAGFNGGTFLTSLGWSALRWSSNTWGSVRLPPLYSMSWVVWNMSSHGILAFSEKRQSPLWCGGSLHPVSIKCSKHNFFKSSVDTFRFCPNTSRWYGRTAGRIYNCRTSSPGTGHRTLLGWQTRVISMAIFMSWNEQSHESHANRSAHSQTWSFSKRTWTRHCLPSLSLGLAQRLPSLRWSSSFLSSHNCLASCSHFLLHSECNPSARHRAPRAWKHVFQGIIWVCNNSTQWSLP